MRGLQTSCGSLSPGDYLTYNAPHRKTVAAARLCRQHDQLHTSLTELFAMGLFLRLEVKSVDGMKGVESGG